MNFRCSHIHDKRIQVHIFKLTCACANEDFFFVEQEETKEMKNVTATPALKTQTILKNPNELLLLQSGLTLAHRYTVRLGHHKLSRSLYTATVCQQADPGYLTLRTLRRQNCRGSSYGTVRKSYWYIWPISANHNFPKSTLPLLSLLEGRKRRQLFSIKCKINMLKYRPMERHILTRQHEC